MEFNINIFLNEKQFFFHVIFFVKDFEESIFGDMGRPWYALCKMIGFGFDLR